MNANLANCQSWALRGWPPVLWQPCTKASLHLRHVGTHVSHPGDQINRCSGQTIWAAESEDGEAGVAWDWIQLSRGIVAMADPMTVVTNLRLVSPEGDVLTAFEAARHLNSLLHQLPWQDEVERVLAADLN